MDEIVQQAANTLTGTESVLAVAKGITDYTILVIIASAYIVTTLMLNLLWWYFSKKQSTYILEQHGKIVQGMIDAQQGKLDSILENAKQTDNKLNQLKEAITGEEFNKVRVAASYGFDFNKLSVALFINETKTLNNLDNRSGIEKSVRMTIDNLYNRFVNDMDNFEYNGRKLSYFFDPEWKERVYEFCVDSIYDGKQNNCGNYIKSLSNYFDEFKVKFFDKLRKS